MSQFLIINVCLDMFVFVCMYTQIDEDGDVGRKMETIVEMETKIETQMWMRRWIDIERPYQFCFFNSSSSVAQSH